ncbi:MAG TPA: hypothetical protein VIJ82_21850 [Streptosporangiaceae bacterium]
MTMKEVDHRQQDAHQHDEQAGGGEQRRGGAPGAEVVKKGAETVGRGTRGQLRRGAEAGRSDVSGIQW